MLNVSPFGRIPRRPDLDSLRAFAGRWWWLAIALALCLALPMGLVTIGRQVLSRMPQVIFAWMMTIGLFRLYLARENATIRHHSESAY